MNNSYSSMSREQIEQISGWILSNGDITAKHGTSIEKAKKIIETGFYWHRPSFIIQHDDNIEHLYGYAWKANEGGDVANVIIQIPKEFYLEFYDITEEEYDSIISGFKKTEESRPKSVFFATEVLVDPRELVINSFSEERKESISFDNLTTGTSRYLPREFIVGAFIRTDDNTYLSAPEASIVDNLTFISNDQFYSNLSAEQKNEFMQKMKNPLINHEHNNNQSTPDTLDAPDLD